MSGWKKICCAVDFAGPSWAALRQAAELAERSEAELTVVHVRAPLSEAAGHLAVAPELATRDEIRAEEMLARWCQEAEARAHRPVHACMLSGHPAVEILRHVREEECDLLITGTHGRTGLSRAVLGSVAERVARRAPCPVLMVHDHELLEKEEIAEEAAQYR
jgi:nucleotide-binding universal stress UspA family protein